MIFVLRFIAVALLFGFGGMFGYILGAAAPVPEPKTCPVCPKLPENYFTIETIETEQCVTAVGDTIVSRIVKQSKVETE
jgi:hypothetical protein